MICFPERMPERKLSTESWNLCLSNRSIYRGKSRVRVGVVVRVSLTADGTFNLYPVPVVGPSTVSDNVQV